jgi:hypothetical protein
MFPWMPRSCNHTKVADKHDTGITRHGWNQYADLLVLLYIRLDLNDILRFAVYLSTLERHRSRKLQ